MFIGVLSYPGLHLWKVDGTLTGSDLEAQDCLLLDFYLSKCCFFLGISLAPSGMLSFVLNFIRTGN